MLDGMPVREAWPFSSLVGCVFAAANVQTCLRLANSWQQHGSQWQPSDFMVPVYLKRHFAFTILQPSLHRAALLQLDDEHLLPVRAQISWHPRDQVQVQVVVDRNGERLPGRPG